MSSSERLEARARQRAERAFVRGRIEAALRVLWVPAIMIVIAVLRGHSWSGAIALGAGLALAAGYFRYRGGVLERAVGPAQAGAV